MSGIEHGLHNREAVSLMRINERVGETFRGQASRPSTRRELLKNWAKLYSGFEVSPAAVETPAQLAVILPEQLNARLEQVDHHITAAGLSEAQVAQAAEAAQQALLWSTKPENSGRQFNFGFLRIEAMRHVASLLFAVLFMLTTGMTALAAGDVTAQDGANAAGVPATGIESGTDTVQGGGSENEPVYQTFAVFNKDANVRKDAGTNFSVSYKATQGEMLPVTGKTKKDKTGYVWREVVIITENGNPKVTGWVREDLVKLSEQIVEAPSGGIGNPELTPEQVAETITAINAISTTTGIGLVEFMHPAVETVAITTATGITTEGQIAYYLTRKTLDETNQELVAAIVILNNNGGDVLLVPASQDPNPGNGGRTLIGPVVASVDIEGAWVPVVPENSQENNGGQEQNEAMPAMQAKLLDVMEKNTDVFPKELTEQVKQLPFDENRGCFVVQGKGCYFPFKTSPHYENTTLEEGLVDMSETSYMEDEGTGARIYFGTAQGSLVENLRWNSTKEKATKFVQIYSRELGLAQNYKLRIINVDDVTGESEGEHLPLSGRRNIEAMLVQIDTAENAQLILVRNEAGEISEVTAIISIADELVTEAKDAKGNIRGRDAYALFVAREISGETFINIDAVVNKRGPRDQYDSLGVGKKFSDAYKNLYDFGPDGKVLAGQLPLFAGDAVN